MNEPATTLDQAIAMIERESPDTLAFPPPHVLTLAAIEKAALSEAALDALVIPARRALLGDWFYEGDLGLQYAKRGTGKTWLGLVMARALADGAACGPWKAGNAVKVLYVDGEMHLGVMRERNQALRNVAGDNLIFLSHQNLFDAAGVSLCLSDPAAQHNLTEYCVNHGIKVLFLDNLSTLFSGVEENKADDWRDMVEPWLLGLRRRGIAVVIIAHAGRNGLMRGTSKREDAAFWQIVLDPVDKEGDGTHFISRFTKNRNTPGELEAIKWHFRPEDDRVNVTWEKAEALQIFRVWIQDGLTSCSEIAEEMGISKGSVSKLAKRAQREGWLEIKGRDYKLKGDC